MLSRLPRRWVCLDTEAWRRRTADGERHQFRCAVAVCDAQDHKGDKWRAPLWGRFTSARDLWEWVDGRTVPRRRTVLVAHNLGYDLRVGQAFEHLPALGYTLEMIRLDGGNAWCQWRRTDRSLLMIDSMSWFGASVEHLGVLIGEAKLPLPPDDAPMADWLERCESDVQVLRLAWGRVVKWLDEGQLGNFKATGAGMAWANFRHEHMKERVLHHGMERVAKVEREAAWTGRCEAWRWGDLGVGPWDEWDLESAYAHVAYDHDVPVRLRGHRGAAFARSHLSRDAEGALLVRADVSTAVPCLPCRSDTGIYWPVGTFRGWWWDIELRAAITSGSVVRPIEAWEYGTAPLLKPWAEWVLDKLAAGPDDFDPVLRLVVKNWSRALVGRFGARWAEWEDYGAAAPGGVLVASMSGQGPDDARRVLSLCGKTMVEGEKRDAHDAAVHVMSFVMAACRTRLWRCMLEAGLGHVAYVDTDGLLVDAEGSENLRAAELPGLRLKSSWRHVEVLGPRQLVLDGRLKAAGVPSKARRAPGGKWEGEVWRSLPVSLGAGELSEVRVQGREWSITGTDHRRAHLADGATAALVHAEPPRRASKAS